MDQRLLFVLTEDKQTIQGEGVNVLITQTKVLHICLEVGKICTLCIAILEVGPLALQNQQYHGSSQLPTMMCNSIWPP
jgi:hypothetical protein